LTAGGRTGRGRTSGGPGSGGDGSGGRGSGGRGSGGRGSGGRSPGREGASAEPSSARRTALAADARGLALQALVEIAHGARANVALPALLSSSRLEARDRAFVTELVYGTVRMQRACDWAVDKHLHRDPDLVVRLALRLGAYQLIFLHTPVHAAVSATVDHVEGPARGMVNAVLRKVASETKAGPITWPTLAVELSYPDWIVRRLLEDLGPAAGRAALEEMNLPASATMRSDGYFQDVASQLVGTYAAGFEPITVLDLCAAPGGKATSIAQRLGLEGPADRPDLVVAADLDYRRTLVVEENISKLELTNVAALCADGLKSPFRTGSFDQVLVDAPCSGLGVLRRRADARWRVQPADVVRLTELQRGLVASAVPLLRPGGVLIYNVCTVTMLETAGVDRWISETYPNLMPLDPPGPPFRPSGRGALLLPQAAGTDGMFILGLRLPLLTT
jgi:16S rRNA (cytosine967-C5)-methyltransferase